MNKGFNMKDLEELKFIAGYIFSVLNGRADNVALDRNADVRHMQISSLTHQSCISFFITAFTRHSAVAPC